MWTSQTQRDCNEDGDWAPGAEIVKALVVGGGADCLEAGVGEVFVCNFVCFVWERTAQG